MIEDLLDGICIIAFIYPDDSKKVIHTSLNKDILAQVGVKPRPGFLYDFVRKVFVKFDPAVQKVQLLQDLDELGEVDSFANQFI